MGEHQTCHPQNQTLPVRKWSVQLGLRDLKFQVLLSLTACSDWALLTSHSPQDKQPNQDLGLTASLHPKQSLGAAAHLSVI